MEREREVGWKGKRESGERKGVMHGWIDGEKGGGVGEIEG